MQLLKVADMFCVALWNFYFKLMNKAGQQKSTKRQFREMTIYHLITGNDENTKYCKLKNKFTTIYCCPYRDVP